MIFVGSHLSRISRFLQCGESAETDARAGNADLCIKFASPLFLENSYNTGFSSRRGAILHILSVRSLTKIAPAIVRSVSIFVLAFWRWPTIKHVEKSEPVGEIESPINADLNVAMTIERTRWRTGSAATSGNQPLPQPGFWIVFKQAFERVLCNHVCIIPQNISWHEA